MIESLKEPLSAGLDALGLTLKTELFLEYIALLQHWNRAYNLTAIREPLHMVTHHLLDSLAVLSWVHGPRVIDVGTGAGLPGIPLAIALPDVSFTLLDSNGKKTRFLDMVKDTLALKNVDVVHARVETYHPQIRYTTIVSRAFTQIMSMITATRHLLQADGQWLAMKGRIPHEELADITLPYRIESYAVPFMDSDRCCVSIKAN